MDSMELSIIRQMAWERAKGELRSILVIYIKDMERYRQAQKKIEGFIKDIEENGIIE